MDGRGTPLRTWEKLYWGVFVLIQQTQTRSSGCKGEVMLAGGTLKLDRLDVIVD
jgi:hypothetical protein